MALTYKVWHIPQVPMPAFEVPCETLAEAIKIRDVLDEYDLFEFENRVKPDYSNAAGIMQLVDGEWEEVDIDDA